MVGLVVHVGHGNKNHWYDLQNQSRNILLVNPGLSLRRDELFLKQLINGVAYIKSRDDHCHKFANI